MKINIEEIRIDGGTQSRVEINQQVVADYAEAIKAGVRMPPVSLYFDGVAYWLVDGFHRYHAHNEAGKTSIDAESKNGTQREAVLYSVGANSDHGLRRSNADKRKAVGILLKDAEWSQWSDGKIADACAVSQRFVSGMREEIASQNGSEIPTVRKVERNGKVYEQNTANIGKNTPPVARSGKPGIPGPSQPETGQGEALKERAPMWPKPGQKGALVDEPDDMLSDVEIMEELQKTLRERDAQIAALSADDKGEELLKQIKLTDHYRREVGMEQDKNARLLKQRDELQKWQNRVCDAVGREHPREAMVLIRSTFAKVAA